MKHCAKESQKDDGIHCYGVTLVSSEGNLVGDLKKRGLSQGLVKNRLCEKFWVCMFLLLRQTLTSCLFRPSVAILVYWKLTIRTTYSRTGSEMVTQSLFATKDANSMQRMGTNVFRTDKKCVENNIFKCNSLAYAIEENYISLHFFSKKGRCWTGKRQIKFI